MIKESFKPYILIGLIVILTEVFVFNARTFQSLFYQERDWGEYFVQLEHGHILENGDIVIEEGEAVLTIAFIDEEIHNICFDAWLTDSVESDTLRDDCLDVRLSIQDDVLYAGEEGARVIYTGTVIPKIENSKYIFFESYGNIHHLQIAFSAEGGSTVHVDRVVLNAKRPLQISVIRILIGYLLIGGIYFLLKQPGVWKAEHEIPKKKRRICSYILYLGFMMILFWWINQNPLYLKHSFQPYHELARSLSLGKLYVLTEPSEMMKDLEQATVSWSEDTEGILFDYAYFNGHYYVYFGILPCLVFYLPYYLLTGKMLANLWVLFILVAVTIPVIHKIYGLLIERFFTNASFLIHLILDVITVFGTQMVYSLMEPFAYTVPILMGACLTLWGIYFWMRAAGKDSTEQKYLFCGSICMALVAACRPTMLLYSFVSVLLFYSVLVKRKKSENTQSKQKILKSWICFALPYIIVAIPLMWYNYARFGSVFDFGMFYNTTSLPSKGLRLYLPEAIARSVWEYLLKIPVMSMDFPYLNSNFIGQTPNPEGSIYYYVTVGFGLLFAYPYLALIFPFSVQHIKRGENRRLWGSILLVCIFGMILMVYTTLITGFFAQRYFLDFSFAFLLAGGIAILDTDRKIKKIRQENVFRICLVCVVLWGMMIQMNQLLVEYPHFSLINGNTGLYYQIYSMFHPLW